MEAKIVGLLLFISMIVVINCQTSGERHKIEAHLSVRHALKAHQGKYQCNTLHSSYHMLKLHKTENLFTKPQLVDSSEEMYFSTQLPEMYLPSVGNTVHQGILPPHTSIPSISTKKYDMPSPKVANVYSNATHFNNMYTLPDEDQPSNSERGFTTTAGREEHLNVFDKSNITGILLVHPSSFPVSPEYIQMITGRMVEQSTPTEAITTRQYYLPVQPAVTTYHNPTTTSTTDTATTTNILPKPFLKKDSDLLFPNYDHPIENVKAFDIKTPLVLSCNITKAGDYDLIWEKNGTDVSKVSSLQGRYRIIKPERKFIIEKTVEKDSGTYSCRVNDVKKEFRVVAKIVVRVPSNSGVVEGEKLSIHCVVAGTEPRLYWKMGNLTIYNSTGRYELQEDENKIQNAILTMDGVSLNDRGDYMCLGSNIINDLGIADPASDTSFVRVKGKFAALWPFLGICAEVLILCTIILIYEKRRNKTELEESDTDPNTEQ